MDRETRNLMHQKANKPKIAKGTPSPNEGSNGDEQLRITSDGLVLYKKVNNKWYSFLSTSSGTFINIERGAKGDGVGVNITDTYIILNDKIKIVSEGDDLVLYKKDGSGNWTIELQRWS